MKKARLYLGLTSILLSACATVGIQREDPSFRMRSLSQKTLTCSDNSLLESPLLDLDGMYAKSQFGRNYARMDVFTMPILDSICAIIAANENARVIPSTDPAAKDADFSIVFKTLYFHNRVSMTSTLAVKENRSSRMLATITVEAEDKFSFGGDGRFREAFENLKASTIQNFAKDYKVLLDTTSGSASRQY